MMNFKASVQYNDWVGSAAADDADAGTLRQMLVRDGLITDDDAIVGIRVWIGENHGGNVEPASVEILTVPMNELAARMRDHPVRARSVTKEMSVEQFLGLFKRFAVSLAMRDAEFEEYEVEDGC